MDYAENNSYIQFFLELLREWSTLSHGAIHFIFNFIESEASIVIFK